jgi:hypothetical protein
VTYKFGTFHLKLFFDAEKISLIYLCIRTPSIILQNIISDENSNNSNNIIDIKEIDHHYPIFYWKMVFIQFIIFQGFSYVSSK